MQSCQCSVVSRKAREGNYDFLAKQIGICEQCVYYGLDTSNEQEQTYTEVRLNYVKAYWNRVQSNSTPLHS